MELSKIFRDTAATLKANYSPFPELVQLLEKLNVNFLFFVDESCKFNIVLLFTTAANSVTLIGKYVNDQMISFMAEQIFLYSSRLQKFSEVPTVLHE